MSRDPSARRRTPAVLRWLLPLMIVAVLVGGIGFAYKIVQFARESFGTEGGAFSVPILVYVGMALGFACLLGWAAIRGMFHDIEKPKYRMLEREEEYERDGI